METYKRCKRCVMSEKSDPTITFDAEGKCNYCTQALSEMKKIYFPNEEGEKKLQAMLATLKEKNKSKAYDCLMGISGGLDSCYLAYLGAHKWGLRIAAVHIDDGFDTEVSKENVRKLCEKCHIDLKIIQPDAEQYYALTLAYMKAGVPNLAVPQDNVLLSCIYKFAKENDVRYFLSGVNFALECILQRGNTYDPFDLVNIKDINRLFGAKPLNKLPLMSRWERMRDKRALNVVEYRPLDYINYTRAGALKELSEFCDFQYYGSKHLENYFTGFLQLYWMPQKFGVDKRTSHLSSMIVSGEITREEALEKLKEPLYTQEWLNKVIALIKEKFKLSDEEYQRIMDAPTHPHEYYKTDKVFELYFRVASFIVKCLSAR